MTSPDIDPGSVRAVAGSISGRVAVAANDGNAYLYDVADDCAWAEAGELDFGVVTLDAAWMAGDGSLLLSVATVGAVARTRIHSLPDGTLQAELPDHSGGLWLIGEHDVSDDGHLWSRLGYDNQYFYGQLWEYPIPWDDLPYDDDNFFWASGTAVPKVSPAGELFATSDGHRFNTLWDESTTSLYDRDAVLLGTTPGVIVGFVDDDHALVAHYSDCVGPNCTYESSDVVAMDGTVVQETALPEFRRITRTTGGQVLARDPGGELSIWDVEAGTSQWSPPAGAKVGMAGPDHVVVATDDSLEVVQWR